MEVRIVQFVRFSNRVFLAMLCLISAVTWAETGVLVVHVRDVQRRPIAGVEIGVEGDGGTSVTGNDGKARIALAKDTKVKSWVSLQILENPPGKDYVLVSPWDYRALVPSFENETDNFVEMVVVQRGDRAALESGAVLAAATAQINKLIPQNQPEFHPAGKTRKLTSRSSPRSMALRQMSWIKR